MLNSWRTRFECAHKQIKFEDLRNGDLIRMYGIRCNEHYIGIVKYTQRKGYNKWVWAVYSKYAVHETYAPTVAPPLEYDEESLQMKYNPKDTILLARKCDVPPHSTGAEDRQ